jgi:hypothetical protein
MTGKPIADAVEEVAKHLGISIGAAKVKLIEACHAGLIRAYWRGHVSKSSPLIPRHEWVGADIDVRRQLVILASGERMVFVDVDPEDFRAWLNPITADGSKKKTDGGYKSKLARKAAAAIWGAARPPADLPPQQVFNQVADKVGELNPGVSIAKSHVLRALGLKR